MVSTEILEGGGGWSGLQVDLVNSMVPEVRPWNSGSNSAVTHLLAWEIWTSDFSFDSFFHC